MAPFAASLASAADGSAQLREVRVWSGGDSTRVVLELSAPARHRFFSLADPARAVIDLKRVRLAPGLRLPAGEGAVRALRTGPQAGGGLRVVLDLDADLPARVLRMPAESGRGERLIIDIGAAAARAGGRPALARPAVDAARRADAGTPASAPQAGGASAAVVAGDAPSVAVQPAHGPGPRDRDVVVVIDAGHGGQDPGAIGPGGTREKDVVLAISRALAARIDREPGMRAVLTRNGDYFLTLRQRTSKARTHQADMFVSVHADAVLNRSVSGSSVYVLSLKGASDEHAKLLAERENAADLVGGVSLDDKNAMLASVLVDLAQSASISASMAAAEKVLRAMNRVGEVRKPDVQQAGFVVLKSPDIPSMLVETAFISNPDDERRLRREEYREQMAQAIFRGIRDYFEVHPPDGTRFARARSGGGGATAVAAR